MQPQLPIEVDKRSGVWSTDGLAMLYVPRHFFNNLHAGIEESLGKEAYAAMLSASGYKSAWYWCDQAAKSNQLQGVEVFEHYLKRLSQRGWGQFTFISQSFAAGKASIAVDNSSFVLHQQHFGLSSNFPVCYMFAGWWQGAADWVAANQGWSGEYQSEETSCVGCGSERCIFTLTSSIDKTNIKGQ